MRQLLYIGILMLIVLVCYEILLVSIELDRYEMWGWNVLFLYYVNGICIIDFVVVYGVNYFEFSYY